MTITAFVSGIRNPYIRCPLVAVWLVCLAPDYFWGAWRADRFGDPEFWQFTWDVVVAMHGGGFVDD